MRAPATAGEPGLPWTGSLYQRLGVSQGADAGAIWPAYQAALAAVPTQGPARWRAWLQGRTEGGLRAAYQVLRDPQRRAAYDAHQAQLLLAWSIPPGH